MCSTCALLSKTYNINYNISLGGLATLSNTRKATDCCCTTLASITLRPPCFCWLTA